MCLAVQRGDKEQGILPISWVSNWGTVKGMLTGFTTFFFWGPDSDLSYTVRACVEDRLHFFRFLLNTPRQLLDGLSTNPFWLYRLHLKKILLARFVPQTRTLYYCLSSKVRQTSWPIDLLHRALGTPNKIQAARWTSGSNNSGQSALDQTSQMPPFRSLKADVYGQCWILTKCPKKNYT